MFNKLPKSLIQKIFEYDITYHQIYNQVISQFKNITPFWRIKWNYNWSSDNTYQGNFVSKYQTIYNIVNYWNHEFQIKHPYAKKTDGKNRYYCYMEFVTDNNKCNIINKIKNLT